MNPMKDLRNLLSPTLNPSASFPLTKEQVIGAYQCFLGREPENDDVIVNKLR